MSKYGHYSPDGREYIITDPRTPRPWFNYLWNGTYTSLISHTGGGFSFLESPRDNRLTRMRYNSLPYDRPGRYVLIKDQETAKYWSLSWAPTIDLSYDYYACHHGQGYTQIITEIEGIRGQITYFVPSEINSEIWRVSLQNLTDRPRKLEVYSFVELLMGNALNDLINQPNDKHFTEIYFDQAHQALVATRRYWVLNRGVTVKQPNIDWKYQILFHHTLPISGFDSSLDRFIGKWRSEANPLAVETSTMGNTEITAGDPIVALQSRLELGGNASIDFAVTLSVVPKTTHPFDQLPWQDLQQTSYLDGLLLNLHHRWDTYLSTIDVDTPDGNFNLMLKVWNPYQAAVTFDMARNAGYYHGGLLFGTGMRDQFQDILGVVMVHPDRVRARILRALGYQFQDGSTLHNFFVLTQTGEKTDHSDTPLWIPFGIMEYLHETADRSLLDEIVPFYDGSSATVYEHLLRALRYALSQLTDRGMPRIQKGDWNDTLDYLGREGKGETVWGAFFLGYVLQKSLPLFTWMCDHTQYDYFQSVYHKLGETINQYAWDGNWYLRAFRDNGKPIGSAQDSQGKIFLNAQSWSVISGLALPDRGSRAIASCKTWLTTPYGMQIVYPAFREVEEDVGLISRCVPGKKENGAVFNHASSWFVLAALLQGEVDFAFDIYQRMMPVNSSEDIDRYEVEPYVYAEYVTSPDHPTQGQASHSWLTGTAVWMLRIGLDYILGFRPVLEGMIIDPHIPSHWPGFAAKRRFRGHTISLRVHNPDRKNQGVLSMIVNGEPVAGNLLRLDQWGPELSVEVHLTR